MRGEDEAAKARVRSLFDRLAPDYDRGGRGCFAYFGRRLVEWTGVEPGQSVLDVACGRGAVLFPAAELAGAAVGIDLAPAMVRAAADEARRRDLAVDLRVMDAERLDFPDASFDRVFCAFGLMFLPNLSAALGEFRRVLAPGGRLGVATWQATESHDLAAVLDRQGFQNPAAAAVLRFNDPTLLEGVLAEAGFAEVRARVEANHFRYADLEEYWQTARGTGARGLLETLDADQTTRVRAALAEQLRPARRDDGFSIEARAVFAAARR